MEGRRIGIVYTGKDCETEKPRLLLGSHVFRWMHWQGKSVPCLLDYGVPCKPCGTQTEYCFLSAAILESIQAKPVADDRAAKWVALPEFQKAALRNGVRKEKPWMRNYIDEMIDPVCRLELFGPVSAGEPSPARYIPGRLIVQCVPGLAMDGIPLDDLRGSVVRIAKDRHNHIKLAEMPLTMDAPEDFDPLPVYEMRYGLHRLRPAKQEAEQEERPATLKSPFRKQA